MAIALLAPVSSQSAIVHYLDSQDWVDGISPESSVLPPQTVFIRDDIVPPADGNQNGDQSFYWDADIYLYHVTAGSYPGDDYDPALQSPLILSESEQTLTVGTEPGNGFTFSRWTGTPFENLSAVGITVATTSTSWSVSLQSTTILGDEAVYSYPLVPGFNGWAANDPTESIETITFLNDNPADAGDSLVVESIVYALDDLYSVPEPAISCFAFVGLFAALRRRRT